MVDSAENIARRTEDVSKIMGSQTAAVSKTFLPRWTRQEKDRHAKKEE